MLPFFCRNLAVNMDVDRASHVVPLGSSAQRRRLRRLRSWWRHERQAVNAALASAQHHSASRVVSTATQTEAPVTEHVVPAPVVTHAAPAPVFEYVTPAPVNEHIVPAPAMTCAVSCQQLPPVYTTTAVSTDVNFDTTGLVHPQFSSTAVEASAPQVVVSLTSFEEFTAPVYNQVHQEQLVAGEMTPNIVENPVVQEQAIVQENSELQLMERIQDQREETTKEVPRERVQ